MKQKIKDNWWKLSILAMWLLTIITLATGLEVHVDPDNTEGWFNDGRNGDMTIELPL